MGDILARADGTMKSVEPLNKKDYTLDELQRFVGGHIEIVDLGKRFLVVNEDGKTIRLPYNMMATNWLLVATNNKDYICGDALLCVKEHIK